MSFDFSAYATDELLQMVDDGEDRGEDLDYEALWTVFGRWRNGIDLDPLVKLLQSEKSSERQSAAWYLDEASPPADLMVDVVIKLANDPISDCRWRFVAYVTNSRLYSDIVADRLAACLQDLDLYVRARRIFWAVVVNDATFSHFSKEILAGAGMNSHEFRDPKMTAFWQKSERKRAARGIEIARRLREGDAIANIQESMPEEDSYTFDQLVFLEDAINRALKRRATQDGSTTTTP